MIGDPPSDSGGDHSRVTSPSPAYAEINFGAEGAAIAGAGSRLGDIAGESGTGTGGVGTIMGAGAVEVATKGGVTF